MYLHVDPSTLTAFDFLPAATRLVKSCTTDLCRALSSLPGFGCTSFHQNKTVKEVYKLVY